MEVIILTGMSGAGKSLVANYLEDMGYFCIDNLPAKLLPELLQSFAKSASDARQEKTLITKMAVVIDIRSFEFFDDILPSLSQLDTMRIKHRILYLNASEEALISRYKQSRRNHPLAQDQSIVQAIAQEREKLTPIREIAHDIIDTSDYSPREMREVLRQLLSETGPQEKINILVQSFGFKYGLPVDCDCVLDVRFIPNPFYKPKMRPLSGLDAMVRDYVLSFEETQTYMRMQGEVLRFTLPYYIREGKVRLTIGVGCTGGRHRSVALAEHLAKMLQHEDVHVVVDHRDLNKDEKQRE